MSEILEPFLKQMMDRSMPTQQHLKNNNTNNTDTVAPIATHGNHQPSTEPISLSEALRNLHIVGVEPNDEEGATAGYDVLDEVLRTQSTSSWMKMVREMESDRSKMLPP